MTLWRCPKCRMTQSQPACVVAVAHRCTPTQRRSVDLEPITDLPSTDGETKGKPKAESESHDHH